MILGKICKVETLRDNSKKVSCIISEGASEAMRLQEEGKEVEIVEKKIDGEIKSELNLKILHRELGYVLGRIEELIIKESINDKKEEELIP